MKINPCFMILVAVIMVIGIANAILTVITKSNATLIVIATVALCGWAVGAYLINRKKEK